MITVELSPQQRAELERVVHDAPRQLAGRARVVLARADGQSLNTIAARVGLHRDSCRRWLLRYRTGGVPGLQHGNTGKPKNVIFSPSTCVEIRRRASSDPATLGESYPEWSLYKLRAHLIRHHIVESISVERLRQLLQDRSVDRRYWHRPTRRIGQLSPEVRQQLVQLAADSNPDRARRARVILAIADGASLAEIASSLHIGKNSVRRWLDYFQLAGVAGLSHGVPTLRDAIVRLTSVPPRAIGASGDVWSLPELRALLLRQGVAPLISLDELRRVAATAGVTLAEHNRRARRQAALPTFAPDAQRAGGMRR